MKRRSQYQLASENERVTRKRKLDRKEIIPTVTSNRDEIGMDIDDSGSEYSGSGNDSDSEDELYQNKRMNDISIHKILNNPVNKENKENHSNNVNTRQIQTRNLSRSRSKSVIKRNPLQEEDLIEEYDNVDVNRVIDLLPCREKEQTVIYNYIKKGLETNGSYTGLYISGMPGTGKTACVTTMINKLKQEALRKEVEPFIVCEINGMKIPNPNNVFKLIYESIFSDGRSTNVKKCTSILDNFFNNRKDFDSKPFLRQVNNPHLVLVIDEIDCLINKKQMLLYNIFNWTTYSNSKLIIISISNTLDLPEKLLPKISSRIGNNRLTFKPYQKDELVKILSVKIENFEMFSDDAIKLASMKVAAVNGDLRRILQICRRAKEIFDLENHPIDLKIDKIYIIRATEDLFDSKVQTVLKSLQLYEKLVIASILFEMKIKQNDKIPVVPIYDRIQYFYRKMFAKTCLLTFDDFMMIVYTLNKLQIINIPDGFASNFINAHVTLKCYGDEFTSAVEKEEKFKNIISEL